MEDIQEQLAALRQRIARVDRKYANAAPPARPGLRGETRPGGQFIEELLSGEVVTTALGQHFETEKLWERHRRHGSVYISDLADLPEDLLDPLSAAPWAHTHPVGLSRYRDYRARRRHRHVRVPHGRGFDRFRRLPAAPVLHAGLRRGSVAALSTGRVSGAIRRADHLQRQVLRPAAARDALPHGPRAPSVRPHAAPRSTLRSAVFGNCGWKAAAWWIWKTAYWVWSARGICPAK
jgi:hypothetical protein